MTEQTTEGRPCGEPADRRGFFRCQKPADHAGDRHHADFGVGSYTWGYVPAVAPVAARQFSVRYPDGFVDGGSFTEAGARQRATELGGEVVCRTVGPWTTIEEPKP